MKVRVITIGRVKSRSHQAIAADYTDRLTRYLSFELLAVKDDECLLRRIRPDDYVVSCDERGKEMLSAEFAKFIGERQVRSLKYMTFVLGGADGVSQRVKDRADMAISLSRFTMQHDLALIVLLEQLYRACTIIKGEKYHK